MIRAAALPLFLSALLLALLAGAGESPPPQSAEIAPGALAPPPKTGGISLVEALWKRASVRSYDARPVARDDLSFVLWAADGVNRAYDKKRTVPSAWGSNAVTVYLASADGVRAYDPLEHSLKMVEASRGTDARPGVAGAEFTRRAPLVLVLVADFRKFNGKAPPDKLLEMATCEAGAICQDVYLAAAARGLGTVVTADVRQETAAKTLGLGPDEKALYTMPLGFAGK